MQGCDVWRDGCEAPGAGGVASVHSSLGSWTQSPVSHQPGDNRVTSSDMWWSNGDYDWEVWPAWPDDEDLITNWSLVTSLLTTSSSEVTRGWPLIVTSWRLLTNPGWCGLDRLPQRLQAGGPGQPGRGPRPRGQDDHGGAAGGADGLPGLVLLSHRWQHTREWDESGRGLCKLLSLSSSLSRARWPVLDTDRDIYY